MVWPTHGWLRWIMFCQLVAEAVGIDSEGRALGQGSVDEGKEEWNSTDSRKTRNIWYDDDGGEVHLFP